jgi:hypothetical protein
MVNVPAQKYLDDIASDFPNTTVLTSGSLLLSDSSLHIPQNVKLLKDFKELLSVASELS